MAAMTEPGTPDNTPVSRAARFVWLTARALEQRRFALHFLDGPTDPVDAALTAYRNRDGGYGHALEPDVRGPSSEPLHVAHALRVMAETGRCEGRLAEEICEYLAAVSDRAGGLPSARPPRAGQPAAPWIPVVDSPPSELLATGPVVGALHRVGVWHPWLFRATDYCWAAIEALEKTHPYEALAAVAFLEHAPDRRRAQQAAERLGRLVRGQQLVLLDPDRADEHPVSPGYAPGEHHYPHDFAPRPGSVTRRWFSDAEIDRSLDFLAAEQGEDGGWPVRWPAWAPGTHLEWRPILTIEALLTLRAYGRPIS